MFFSDDLSSIKLMSLQKLMLVATSCVGYDHAFAKELEAHTLKWRAAHKGKAPGNPKGSQRVKKQRLRSRDVKVSESESGLSDVESNESEGSSVSIVEYDD